MFDLINYDYRKHLSDLLDSFNFDDAFNLPNGHTFDVDEENGDYVLTIPFDGDVDESKIKVTVDNNQYLSVVYGNRTKNSTEFYSFSETLPENANSDTLTATFENNVLNIRVTPKLQKSSKSKVIPITKK